MLRSPIRPVNHTEVQPALASAVEAMESTPNFLSYLGGQANDGHILIFGALLTLVGKGNGDKRGPTALPYSPSSVEVGVVGVISIEI